MDWAFGTRRLEKKYHSRRGQADGFIHSNRPVYTLTTAHGDSRMIA